MLLLSEKIDNALVLTLNRPDVLNALSTELVTTVKTRLDEVRNDASVRAIILTGSGEKAFSAGTDLKERRTFDAEQKWAQSRALWNLNQLIWEYPKPVIALINGWCLGGGFELSLFCDIRIATRQARFGWPEMTLGAYPGGGAAVILPRIIGAANAKELFFTARRFDADEAYRLGLVHYVFSETEALREALNIVGQIALCSPLGVAAVKQSVNGGSGLSFAEAANLDMALRKPLEGTNDYQEGITAFFEKRKPVFSGS